MSLKKKGGQKYGNRIEKQQQLKQSTHRFFEQHIKTQKNTSENFANFSCCYTISLTSQRRLLLFFFFYKTHANAIEFCAIHRHKNKIHNEKRISCKLMILWCTSRMSASPFMNGKDFVHYVQIFTLHFIEGVVVGVVNMKKSKN